MQVTSKKLPRGKAEITVELSTEEYQPFLQKAAAAISEQISFPGFRPGKAPYAVVMERVGEAKLWEEALEPAVRKTFAPALDEAKLVSVGSPEIAIQKLAPGNPVSYRATVNLLPEVELADLSKISIARRAPEVSDAELQRTLDDIRKLHRTEALVLRPAQSNDKVEINLQTFLDNVAVDAGQSNALPLVLGENRFIPGFEQQIIGLSAGQEKTFSLQMPADYHNRMVAGKTVEFRVKVLSVFELKLPELTEDFAKSLGRFTSLDDLRQKIRATMLDDATAKEDERLENEILDVIIPKSKFSDIPDLLVTTETKNMIAELEEQIKQRGIPFEEYLAHMKKSREQLLLDFTPQALKRIKGALITREIAQQQKTEVSEAEVDAAIAKELAAYAHDEEAKKRTRDPDFRTHVKNILASRKVMEHLKKTITK
ncbi:MAG: trigger factor [Patescibacteria group bacterium]|nr:trigger factor [Patescibacteria group bacterium]